MFRYKQGELPRLTEARQAELKALAEQPNDKIDYSDNPLLDATFWAKAVPNPFLNPIKTHASVRIDAGADPAQKPAQGLANAHGCHLARSHVALKHLKS